MTYFLYVQVPFFGAFMSVLGSFLTLTVSVVFPAAAHLKLYSASLTPRETALHWGVIGLGGLCTVTGTASAVTGLMHAAESQQLPGATAIANGAATSFHLHHLICHSLCIAQPL